MYNIWIMNHYATTKGRHSYFAEELAKKGHDVHIFASSFKHNDYKELKKYPADKNYFSEKESNYEKIWIKTPPYNKNGIKRLFNQIAFAYRAYQAAKKMEKPDIVMGSSVHLFTGVVAYYLAKKFNVPFIFEVRDLWPQTLIDLGVLSKYHPATKVFGFLEKFLYKRADKIISVLPDGYKYISSLGIDRDKVVHIPNGVDLSWFDKYYDQEINDIEIKEFFENNSDKLVYAYTGSHGLANGVETLVRAARILHNKNKSKIKILSVGSGPKKEKLKELAKKLKLNNINFMPKVNKDEIPKILAKSDINITIVKESKVHQYGISMQKNFDYMASCKPMIYAIKASNDFAEDANCGISVPPDNPEALAEAMIGMKNISLAKRKELGKNGRNYVEKYYDYPVLADRLLDIIKETT